MCVYVCVPCQSLVESEGVFVWVCEGVRMRGSGMGGTVEGRVVQSHSYTPGQG